MMDQFARGLIVARYRDLRPNGRKDVELTGTTRFAWADDRRSLLRVVMTRVEGLWPLIGSHAN